MSKLQMVVSKTSKQACLYQPANCQFSELKRGILGIGTVAYQVAVCSNNILDRYWCESWLLHLHLPANLREKAAEDGPSALALVLMWETLEKIQVPGFGLAQPGPLQPFGKWMEDFSLFLSHFLPPLPLLLCLCFFFSVTILPNK